MELEKEHVGNILDEDPENKEVERISVSRVSDNAMAPI